MDDTEREAARRELGNVPDSGPHVMVRAAGTDPAGRPAYGCAACWDAGEVAGEFTWRWPCRPALLARVAATRERAVAIETAARLFVAYRERLLARGADTDEGLEAAYCDLVSALDRGATTATATAAAAAGGERERAVMEAVMEAARDDVFAAARDLLSACPPYWAHGPEPAGAGVRYLDARWRLGDALAALDRATATAGGAGGEGTAPA